MIAKEETIQKANAKTSKRFTKKRGYKLVVLSKVTKDQSYVVAASIIPIHRSELKVTKQLVNMAIGCLPEKTLRLLLIDRGFMDGKLFNFLKEKGIDFIVPTKDNMHITNDMRGLAKLSGAITAKAKDGAELAGVSSLQTLSTCDHALRGVLVTKTRDGETPENDKQFGFVTSLPASRQAQVVRVYESYRRRWTIETNCFEELKRAWFLNSFPGRSFRAVCAHVLLTLFMFNAVKAFLTDRGEEQAVRGLISLRHRYLKPHRDLVVYQGEHVAILTLAELLDACGLPPPGKYKNARIRIIWPDFTKG